MKADRDNIILIGFMGSGKTRVGRILAAETGKTFVDTDEEIERLLDISIPAIFHKHGERRFRSEETMMLEKVCRRRHQIISTGGGAVLAAENVRLMRECGAVVWLRARPETLVERIGAVGNRPLLSDKNRSVDEVIKKKLAEREALYRSAAQYWVPTDDLSAEQVAARVLHELGLEGFRLEKENSEEN